MSKPIKLVAICQDISGGCEYVALVKNIDESEYAKLLYEQRQREQKRKKEIKDLESQIESLKEECSKLLKEIKVLKGEEDYEESI